MAEQQPDPQQQLEELLCAVQFFIDVDGVMHICQNCLVNSLDFPANDVHDNGF